MPEIVKSSRGLVSFSANGKPDARIYCLPYAGGSASIFAGWRQALPANLEVCAIELPGRGGRFSEPALTHMDAVVDELVRVVGDRADVPFALFGHSMGAVIAVELARRLVDLGRRPTALVASACAAPHLPLRREHVLHVLPRDALIDALIRLNGLPAVALERRDFIDTFMPTIRADLQCRETWRSTPRDLGIPVHVLAGKDDELVSEADALAWQVFTSTQFSITRFDGGHFFIQSAMQAVLDHLATIVLRSLQPCHGSPASPARVTCALNHDRGMK
ncbi:MULTISPECIES: thioesterase II family protein [Burkholderia]|uniref:thioesterase II family protein n=1 Tax=Burkholderia TaxID=32008 RepID=UPI000B7ACA58|nr:MULTISPECIES: alpha/beta fold hydrolase [Burkholderia]OXI94440.1 thioesterase [Burkholderia sp. AU33803]PRD84183.1 thioesterase [Burkholderia contaminans]